MRPILLQFLFVVEFSLLIATSEQETEIQLVQILFRHGDRTPVRSYPTNPVKESAWNKYGGYGQLTQKGMKQHFEFGKFLRKQYKTFLNKYYNRENIKVLSTNFDRTLMSAYSLLNGLYNPIDYQIWNDEVKWQPIPVFATQSSNDFVFYGDTCPRFKQLKNEVEHTEEYLNKNKKYQHLFEVIDKNSGCDLKSGCANMSLDDEWKIGDCFFVEKSNGFKLPDWAESVYDRLIESLRLGFYFKFRFTEMAKLQSGGVLKDMRKNIHSRVKNKHSLDQLRLYSGHDTYVAALTKLLNVTEFIYPPPYASAIALELRKELNKENYFIRVYLKNNTADQEINYQNLTIYGCENLCPLDKFMKMTENLVTNDYEAECQLHAHSSIFIDSFTNLKNNKFYYNIGLVILILSLITAVLIIIAVFKKSRSNQIKYDGFEDQQPM